MTTNPAIRQRLAEFLGGDSLDQATAVYLTRTDGGHEAADIRPPADLDWFLDRDLDIARSLADTASLLLHLDVEHVNYDSPAEAFVDPWRVFDLQEPVVNAIESLLLENMLPHLLFGRASDMLYLLGEIREPTVRACLDTGHANLSGDLPGIIHKLSGHLKMAHVNDNCGDRDSHLIPGEGLIDWRQVMSALREQHFHGGLIIEMAAQPGEPVEHTLSRAVRAREFLGNLAG